MYRKSSEHLQKQLNPGGRMELTQPQFAFGMAPNERLNIAKGNNDTLASMKIRSGDQESKATVVFFRIPQEDLRKLQAKGLVDSSKTTAHRLKDFLVAQGNDPEKVDRAMKNIRKHNRDVIKNESGIKAATKAGIAKESTNAKAGNSSTAGTGRRASIAGTTFRKVRHSLSEGDRMHAIPFSILADQISIAVQRGALSRVDYPVSGDRKKDSKLSANKSEQLPESGATAHAEKPEIKSKPLPPVPSRMKPLPPTPTKVALADATANPTSTATRAESPIKKT